MGSIIIRIAKDFEQLEEQMRRMMDNLFGPGKPSQGSSLPRFRPAVDVYETPDEMVLRMELAGVVKEELSITLNQQQLNITGRRRFFTNDPIQRFLQLEIDYGLFDRTFKIPKLIEETQVQAEYHNGILEVRLPFRRPSPTKTIAVQEE
ncbi:MAG: Hsp20/alpha crystallin family protein [Desulfobacteraceae bacterium]